MDYYHPQKKHILLQKELKSLKICSEQWMEFYEIGPDDFKNGFNQLTGRYYLSEFILMTCLDIFKVCALILLVYC